MMNKRWILVLLALLMLVAFSGCQLAREEEAGEAPEADRLIGVFITLTHLDLFDFEGYLSDNLYSFSGGEIEMDGAAGAYQGRLYATREGREYAFEGVEGIAYFAPRITDGGEHYIDNSADEAISDNRLALHQGDEEEKITMEGTVFVSVSAMEQAYYINPVYQSADGNVYATSGSGFLMDGMLGEGAAFAQTMEETTTVTENETSKSVSMSIHISIESMLAPERIVLLQMDEESNIVARDVFAPGAVPEELAAHPDAAYMVLETHKTGTEGAPVVTRELFVKGDERLHTFYCRSDGICIKKWVSLTWA